MPFPILLDMYLGVLLILAVIGSAIFSERAPSYLLIFLTTLITLWIRREMLANLQEWTFHLSIAVIGVIVVETVKQLKSFARNHIRRLETITDFSRNITSTLDTKQVMALLNAAFQNAVEADTYFVGFREGDEMRLELVYDDGEYFENQRTPLEGSLSSWVLTNHRSLFLPDLRKEVTLPESGSCCWGSTRPAFHGWASPCKTRTSMALSPSAPIVPMPLIAPTWNY